MDDVARLSELSRSLRLRIAVAESLTSGKLASVVGAGDGAAEWFTGGVIAYFTEVKERLLGLTPGTDPCSPDSAEQIAAGVRELLDADLSVSTTGVGGPDPVDGHEPGTVYLGWATRSGTGHRRLTLAGDPGEVLDAAVTEAVRLLLTRATEEFGPTAPDRR